MSMDKLIILRDAVAIVDDVECHPNIPHFLGNAVSLESFSIPLVISMRISDRFGQLNAKLVCAL